MSTNNSWNNAVTAANTQLNGGTAQIGTDAADNTISIGTGASAGRTVTVGNATGTTSVAVNCGTGGVTVGTSANAHTTTIGSVTSTSATTVQSGSGALNITSTNGPQTHNSGTGALGISTDSSATTVSIATGGAAKALTIGSTNTTSATTIQSGSGNIIMNTGLTVSSGGLLTNSKQPAFYAFLNANASGVTGDNTNYTVAFNATKFDQASNFNTSTHVFTAPVAGKYFINFSVLVSGLGSGFTNATTLISINALSSFYQASQFNPFTASTSTQYQMVGNGFISLSANDTVGIVINIGSSTKSITVDGDASNSSTYIQGFLVC